MKELEAIFTSVFLGDALGAPFEFKTGRDRFLNSDTSFTNFLYPTVYINRRFPNIVKILARGRFTDDSEMTIILISVFLDSIRYGYTHEQIQERLIFQYVRWAIGYGPYPKSPFMGRNTRKLFVMNTVKMDRIYEGVLDEDEKTVNYIVDKYKTNFKKRFNSKLQKETALSNGSLMRCTGLLPFLIFDTRIEHIVEIAKLDVYLTNPNMISLQTVTIYLKFILEIWGRSKVDKISYVEVLEEVVEDCRDYFDGLDKSIEKVLSNVLDGSDDVLTFTSKGYILCAFYLALKCYLINSVVSWKDCMDWVIRQGGDTDTNGAIAGGILGIVFGESLLEENSDNIEILKNASIDSEEISSSLALARVDEDQDYDFSFKTQRPPNLSYTFVIEKIQMIDRCIQETKSKY